MRRILGILGLLAALVTLGGCFATPTITVLSSHTLAVGQGMEVDAIWVEHGGVLKRCTNTPNGPICVPAQQP
jgi:hypothetical protein